MEITYRHARTEEPPTIEQLNQSVSQLLEADQATPETAQEKARDLRFALDAFEKQLIIDALKQHEGHREKTATMLGIDRKTLYLKMKKYAVT